VLYVPALRITDMIYKILESLFTWIDTLTCRELLSRCWPPYFR
jgi:hypothetical protein